MNTIDEDFERVVPALCIPDERTEWGTWLDRQIMGLELRKLVQQLLSLGGQHPPKMTLDQWLGSNKNLVLAEGLQAASPDAIEILFQNPALLLDLQGLVLEEGGDYWESVPISKAHQEATDRVKKAVLQKIESDRSNLSNGRLTNSSPANLPAITSKSIETPSLPAGSVPRPNTISAKGWWFAAVAAMAAAILIGLFNPFSAPKQELFFAASSLQATIGGGQESLRRMSRQITTDWKSGLSNRDELKSQLIAFRNSCDLLIDGPLVKTLEGLPPASITDVRDRCRNWKKLATELIANLDSGKATSEVAIAADAMIDKLTNKLNEIATST